MQLEEGEFSIMSDFRSLTCYGFSTTDQQLGEVAIKVYKTTLNEFKNRGDYVQDDYRFKNPRKIMKIWAEKEMLNLNRYIALR